MTSRILTCPIFYLNSKPHIGHLYTLTLADTQKRFLQKRYPEQSIKLSTGTDEHGTKILQAAQKSKKNVKKFCDANSNLFKNLQNKYNISNDDFIRTTEERHKTQVHKIWNEIDKTGDFSLEEYQGWYCASDETFVAERDTVELNDKRVMSDAVHNEVNWLKEKNYVFDLDKYLDPVMVSWIKNNVKPEAAAKQALNHLSKLKYETNGKLSVSRPISRLNHAIPVPNDPEHGVYVWLDALTNYLTTNPEFQSQEHIVGKDILKFHCVYWPAFLRSAGYDIDKHTVIGHGHWTIEGVKMSKSLGNVVDPVKSELVNVLNNEDAWRWFLLYQANADLSNSIFSRDVLSSVINKTITGGIGVLLNRVGSQIDHYPINPDFTLKELQEAHDYFKKVPEKFEKSALVYDWNSALRIVMESVRICHGLLQDVRPDKCDDENLKNSTLAIILEVLRVISVLIEPVTPKLVEKIVVKLDLQEEHRSWESIEEFYPELIRGKIINKKKKVVFFKRIEAEKILNAKVN